MKIAAYEVRPDEKPIIEGLCKEYGIELVSTPANLDASTDRAICQILSSTSSLTMAARSWLHAASDSTT